MEYNSASVWAQTQTWATKPHLPLITNIRNKRQHTHPEPYMSDTFHLNPG